MTASAAMRRSTLRGGGAKLLKAVAAANSGQVAGTTLVLTVGAGGVPAGSTVVVRSASDYTNTGATCADARGNTYQVVRTSPATGNAFRATMLASTLTTALSAGDAITLTYAASVANRAAAADAFTGLRSPLSFVQNGSAGTGTNPATSVTTTAPNTLVVAMTGLPTAAGTAYTQDPAFAGLPSSGTTGTAPFITVEGGYQVLGATNTARYRPSVPASVNWVVIMAAFTV